MVAHASLNNMHDARGSYSIVSVLLIDIFESSSHVLITDIDTDGNRREEGELNMGIQT